ncbi:hypothetical protein [Rhizobium sp. ZW T2_16]|uniref:hypothetical protein n=1 Tax=Rhizobium sp. ZW T2_16 TaxID=3378083 RepID=UPI003853D1C5
MSEFLQFAINKSPIRLTCDDILLYAGALNHWDFYNSAALEIAKGYHRGELSYSFCDGVMNDLWSAVQEGFGRGNNEVPEPFFEIYEAFDVGEYHRKHDKSDDPIAEFTDPAIAELSIRYNL